MWRLTVMRVLNCINVRLLSCFHTYYNFKKETADSSLKLSYNKIDFNNRKKNI